MLAVTTSDIQPLPHQLRAVYGELLPRTPLRFLLADDPGAGKTIMAGLYIKELILREDVKRCLIVAPGGLVDQWQDELYLKFGLAFEILTPQFGETVFGASAFEQHPLLIARMDQLARNEELQAELAKSEWDLVVVDEAHRMGAHYFGGKLEKTKRFQLGELLGDIARHLLLMTATPHSGKEEDFQLFLTLLDRDRFEGKYQAEGPQRRHLRGDAPHGQGGPAHLRGQAAVPRADRRDRPLRADRARAGPLRAGHHLRPRGDEPGRPKLDGKRRNTVGFALTVLQRRLASSPEAIYRSLERRAERLERRKQEVLAGGTVVEPKAADVIGALDEFDDDEFSAEEIEEIEEELVDAATAARTVEELDAELLELADLIEGGRARPDIGHRPQVVRAAHDPRGQHARTTDAGDERRKLIVFTEHRDTLDYLAAGSARCSAKPEAVKAIHGGVRRSDRRQITEEFTKNPDVPDPPRHRRRRRGPEPPGRAPDGQLRPAVEPEPDRAALRPHPPHRPGGGLPPVEPRRRQHPRGRGVHPAARQDRGAAQGLRRQGVRRARRRRSPRRRCGRC